MQRASRKGGFFYDKYFYIHRKKMQAFIQLILKLLGIVRDDVLQDDPLSKNFDYDSYNKRRQYLEDNYIDLKADFPKTGIRSTIYRSKPAIFSENEVVKIAENILHFQNPDGGWSKKGNYRNKYSKSQLQKIYEQPSNSDYERDGSDFDNGCTWGHIEYLSRVYDLTADEVILDAIKKALRFIVKSQHPNGSWENKNHRHITYNDNVIPGVLNLLLSIQKNKYGRYTYLEDISEELDLETVYRKGIDCILSTQIKHEGKKAIWGQQHDHDTLEPTWARSYEMPSYATSESVKVINLLKNHLDYYPEDKEVRESWLSAIEFIYSLKLPEGQGDPDGDGQWARFYELDSLKPIFANREYDIVYSIEEVKPERRYGYGWFNNSAYQIIE